MRQQPAGSRVVCVERLTLLGWGVCVLPYLLRMRVSSPRSGIRCDVVDGSWIAVALARLSASLAGVSVERLRFRLVDVRDPEGLLIRLRLHYQDLAQVQADVVAQPSFQAVAELGPRPSRLWMYCAKGIANINPSNPKTTWRALLCVQVCRWHTNAERGPQGGEPILFLEPRPWWPAIERYAARYQVKVVAVNPWRPGWPFRTRRMLRWLLEAWHAGMRWLTRALSNRTVEHTGTPGASSLKVAVPYCGHLNLKQPERYSDLFFWQQSTLPGRHVLLMFAWGLDPLDSAKWSELKDEGIPAVALTSHTTSVPEAPRFFHWPRIHSSPEGLRLSSVSRSLDARWVREQWSEYLQQRDYWADLFAAYGVKVYLSWYKSDGVHCAIADAIQDLGGVSVFYQRSYETNPSVETAVSADLAFGFSQWQADIERRSGSQIDYHVTTGYLGDHRFALLRKDAQRIREALSQHGATRILAYCDVNSLDDARWQTGHEFMRESYAFLLERVLAEPWLGLLLKPKAPASLRRRLGPVAELLRRAEATGRCRLYEEGVLQGSFPPAAAALASDLAIHGYLLAATAGVESALAGVPTLLLDREGWHVSPLYALGLGRVVFTDWPALWQACVEHWTRPGGRPGFGDWAPMLDRLDPFRDGRAAERMGTYLQWLLEGFNAGLSRETVLADAAERYALSWGKDKVTQVNVPPDRQVSFVLALAQASGASRDVSPTALVGGS